MKYTIVAGSFEYYHTWYRDPASPFNALMRGAGLTLGAVFAWNGGITMIDFLAATDALRCHLRDVPEMDRNLVAYSNGGQAPLILASQGFPIRTLSTVGTPCRDDINLRAAAQQIQYHQAIYDDTDLIRWLGEAHNWPPVPYFPYAHRYNLRDIGHGKVLFDAQYLPFWVQMGWIEAIRSLSTSAEEAHHDRGRSRLDSNRV